VACALVLALPVPASAQTASGGAYASDPAVVTGLACRAGCAEDAAAPGATVRVSGRSLGRVRHVVFLGGPGNGDDRVARVTRTSAAWADVVVPAGALTGRVRLRNADGNPSRPSTATIAIGAPAGAEPAAPDRDTSDRIDAHVAASTVYVAGQHAATLAYTVTGPAPVDVAVEVVRVRDGRAVRRWAPGVTAPGTQQRIEWDGTAGGTAVAPGRYEFRAYPAGASAAQAGAPLVADSFLLRDHHFPVRGEHGYGGYAASFGGGRGHQGQDVFAACGTPLVAARGGAVRFKATHARAGNYVVIDGEGTEVDYVYMHLAEPAVVERGERVYTGQRIGSVGDTGRAHGCHLHFELWSGPGWYRGGDPFDPLPLLRAWDAAERRGQPAASVTPTRSFREAST